MTSALTVVILLLAVYAVYHVMRALSMRVAANDNGDLSLGGQGSAPRMSDPDHDLASAFVHLAVFVARGDGNVTTGEVQAIRDFFGRMQVGPELWAHVEGEIRVALDSVGHEEALEVLNELVGDYDTRRGICVGLKLVILAGGEMDEVESKLLTYVMDRLSLTDEDKQEILGALAGPSSEETSRLESLRRLGLSEEASLNEIRQAYRRLALQYHPDRVFGPGQEFIDLANRRFVEIKEAYEILTRPT